MRPFDFSCKYIMKKGKISIEVHIVYIYMKEDDYNDYSIVKFS